MESTVIDPFTMREMHGIYRDMAHDMAFYSDLSDTSWDEVMKGLRTTNLSRRILRGIMRWITVYGESVKQAPPISF